jgi:hypothetical protein
MNNLDKLGPGLVLGLALFAPTTLNAQLHGHLNAGAVGTNQNDALIWANGADFAANSGYVKTLDYTNSGRYAGYFQQNITLTALPATPAHAGPDPQAPALGSYIQARMSCVAAPPGGAFGFWENGATAPTISVTPEVVVTNLWPLSESDGSPGSDPYGHFHGRRLTATKPGLYKIKFQAVDTSTNGAGGGPIHQASAELEVWFQAGVNVLSVEPDYEEAHVHVRFAPPANTTWQIEAALTIAEDAAWETVSGPVIGNDLVVEQVVEGTLGDQRYFRLKRIAP